MFTSEQVDVGTKLADIEVKTESLSFSVNSLSSSILDINSIISTLSTGGGGGGGKTLTNPTESRTIFTDPVLYTGTLSGSRFQPDWSPRSNTYMKGVTWSNSPSTSASGTIRTFSPCLENCLVYGDISFVDVNNGYLNNVTASNAVIRDCSRITVSMGCLIGTVSAINVTAPNLWWGTHNSVLVDRCKSANFNGANINHIYSPDCKRITMYQCRIRDVSIEYPTTVTESTSDYSIGLTRNTIDSINAMALTMDASDNDIWTANLYLNYDLMQNTFSGATPGNFVDNIINELSIYNHDMRTDITTNTVISMNGLNFMTNTISHMRVDLYCPITLWSNSIDTLEHTLGVFMSARNNSVLEWDCEISPFSAMHKGLSDSKSLAMAYSNTVGKWNVYHGITDESLFSNNTSPIVTAGLNKLILDISYNSLDYATFDVLNPLNVSFTNGISSALLHVGNRLSVMCPNTIMSLDIVNAELYTFAGARQVTLKIFNAHSLGLTNIFPVFDSGITIDSMNMYADSSMLTGYSLTNASINTAKIAIFNSINPTAPMVIGNCSITYLDYNQRNAQRVQFFNNTINYCSITGGSFNAWTNTVSNLMINVPSASLLSNNFYGLAGTVSGLSVDSCSLSLGGFYYVSSNGQGNTINRLATGF
jgi:hypothetical protein